MYVIINIIYEFTDLNKGRDGYKWSISLIIMRFLNKRTFTILFTIGFFMCWAILWIESLIPGTESKKQSDIIVQIIINIIDRKKSENTNNLNPTNILVISDFIIGDTYKVGWDIIPINTKDDIDQIGQLVRKGIGHFGAFFVLGIFGFMMLILRKQKIGLTLLIIIPVIIMISVGSEILQLFTEGRYCTYDDMFLNISGSITACLFLTFIVLIIRFVKLIFKRQLTRIKTC